MRDHDSLSAERAGFQYLGLTDAEQHVLRLTVLLASAVMKLPAEGNGIDRETFVNPIHLIQDAVITRAAWRKVREVSK